MPLYDPSFDLQIMEIIKKLTLKPMVKHAVFQDSFRINIKELFARNTCDHLIFNLKPTKLSPNKKQ
ncbi:MAG: hypothetical protein COA42_04850 [Alteromonadaceae bacterium]|nr:MAG: hypothetical protein COA42_04850 [Alteromonadaceae bacterium]